MEGKIERKRGRGRPRRCSRFMDQGKAGAASYHEAKEMAHER